MFFIVPDQIRFARAVQRIRENVVSQWEGLDDEPQREVRKR